MFRTALVKELEQTIVDLKEAEQELSRVIGIKDQEIGKLNEKIEFFEKLEVKLENQKNELSFKMECLEKQKKLVTGAVEAFGAAALARSFGAQRIGCGS